MLDLLIITGAGSGIGSSIANVCSPFARTIYLIGSTQKVTVTANRIPHSVPILLDLSNFELTEFHLSPLIRSDIPQCIGIVLCAATLGGAGGIFNSELGDWDVTYRTNVLGNLAVLKAVVKNMHPDSQLRVVFFAGGGAAYAYPEFSGYALSKVATVRAVENVAQEFKSRSLNAAIVALAPGAVATDMLAKVVAHGGEVKTRTDILEPTLFVKRFLTDEMSCLKLSGRFIHVRDCLDQEKIIQLQDSHFKLRRVE